MLKKIPEKIINYLASFLELQLVITLMSLPILICWGLPISYMSPLSNLIFTPLLILFLWLSCLFAICALLHIPCTIFAASLDKLSNFWIWLLSFSKSEWLLGFSHTTLWAAIFISLCIILLYTYRKPSTKQAVIILTIFCLIMVGIRCYTMKNLYQKIGGLPLIAIRLNHKNYLIDYGALCSKQNFYNNIDYTIMPQLIKHTGMTTIDTLILCKSSKRLAKVALQFCAQTNVKTIIATTKENCFKTLCVAYKQSNVQVLPLIKKERGKKNYPLANTSSKFCCNKFNF